MSSVQKECADFLRSIYNDLSGKKLGSGHAHEIVAAFFGYGTGAALRAEPEYELSALANANILIPDLNLMDQRLQQLEGLPAGLPNVDELARRVCDFLRERGYFSGKVWQTRNLADYINSDFIQQDPVMIMDDLSGRMAETNAYFDELDVQEVDLDIGDDALVANVSGSLNGETDPDKSFFGDKIAFDTIMTFQRVAGRIAYSEPDLETSGDIDMLGYYDEDDV